MTISYFYTMTLRGGGGGGPRLNVKMMLVFLKNSLDVSPNWSCTQLHILNQEDCVYIHVTCHVDCLHIGFQIGICGASTIRFRPALIFQPHHAHIFLEGFEAVLRDVTA